jgi:Xaa-Pro aminopeptidase
VSLSSRRDAGSRVSRLASELDALELDALLVDALIDVRYLSGFTGSHGALLVVGDAARARIGRHRFLSDFRYTTQSAEQVGEAFERQTVAGELLEALASSLAPPGAHTQKGTGGQEGGRLGFDDTSLTVKQHARFAELLGESWDLVPCTGAVRRLRAVKDDGEIARIRAAAALADEALSALLEDGLVGRTELDVAIELEWRVRRLGTETASFPSIVAAGPHGALPHAQPRAQPIPADVLVTIDWGAVHEGYCSDCTRTYATGERISAQAREIYALVLSAQEQAVQALRAGPTGREIDAIARAVIDGAGHGEHFGHGLGHGVGLEIHEGPRLSRTAGDEPLRAGNVVTVEPGVYLAGVLGVRIEDLAVVGEESQEILTSLSKALTVIS